MSANFEQQRTPGRLGDAALLFGMFGGALAWSFHLAINYLLVQFLCGGSYLWLLYPASAVPLAIAVWALVLSWRGYRKGKSEDESGRNDYWSRATFMGLFGVLANVLFIYGIVTGTLPVLLLGGCGG